MYTENISRIFSYLIKYSKDVDESRIKINLLDKINKLVDKPYGIDYIIINMMNNIYKARSFLNEEDIELVKREIVERNISNNLENIISRDNFNLKKTISELDIEYNPLEENSINKLSQDIMIIISDYLDIIYEEKISSSEAVLVLETLRDEIISSNMEKLLSEAIYLYNKKSISASQDYVSKQIKVIDTYKNIDIHNLYSTQFGGVTIRSYDDKVLSDSLNKGVDKAYFSIDIEPYNKFVFTNKDLIVIVAGIHTGKTRFATYLAYQAFESKLYDNKIVYFGTETANSRIEQEIESVPLGKYDNLYHIPYSKIRTLEYNDNLKERQELEHYRDFLELNKRRMYDGHKAELTCLNKFSYENCREELVNVINSTGANIIIIDHCRALKSTGEKVNGRYLSDEKSRLAYLSDVLMELRDEYDVLFIVVSHIDSTNSRSNTVNTKLSTTNLTAGATDLSEAGSFMFLLQTDREYASKDRVVCTCTKSRYVEELVTYPVVLQRCWNSNFHYFNPDIQILDENKSIDADFSLE